MNRPGWPIGLADDEVPVYLISVVAEVTGLHPQTLRQYDRLGLVSPGRAAGRGRRYSAVDLARLTRVVELTGEGVNLEGVRRILALEEEVRRLATLLGGGGRDTELVRDPDWMDLPNLPVPMPSRESMALVVWRPGRRRA